jgi:hypothetical protein
MAGKSSKSANHRWLVGANEERACSRCLTDWCGRLPAAPARPESSNEATLAHAELRRVCFVCASNRARFAAMTRLNQLEDEMALLGVQLLGQHGYRTPEHERHLGRHAALRTAADDAALLSDGVDHLARRRRRHGGRACA